MSAEPCRRSENVEVHLNNWREVDEVSQLVRRERPIPDDAANTFCSTPGWYATWYSNTATTVEVLSWPAIRKVSV